VQRIEVEAGGKGWLDDLEVRRDIEITRCEQTVVAYPKNLAIFAQPAKKLKLAQDDFFQLLQCPVPERRVFKPRGQRIEIHL